MLKSTTIHLKPLQLEHAELVFGWRNDPLISSLGSTNKTVSWTEHYDWINKVINSKSKQAYIIFLENIPIGQIRFDRKTELDSNCIISVYIVNDFTGKGIGIHAIKEGCDYISANWENIENISAFVLKQNLIGQKAFIKAGFIQTFISDEKHERYDYLIHRNIPHNKITFDSREIVAVNNVISSGYWAGGTLVESLENKLRDITGCKYAIAVSSGLSALRISLIALGVGINDEVIVPAYSCVALANAVLSVGATPVAVDIGLNDFNVITKNVAQNLSDRTKAIIVVHTFGAVADIASLKKLGIPVIEDCAHALGIETLQGNLGALGDVAICSFYATKLIGGGEGGAILTNNQSIAEIAKEYQDYTDKAPTGKRLNDKLSNIHAVLTITQLEKLAEFINKRKELANNYLELLSNNKDLSSLICLPDAKERIWYRFTVLLKNVGANVVIDKMEEKKIAVRRPIEIWTSEIDAFPNSICAFNRVISLPLYPTLTTISLKQVVVALTNVLTSKK